jgi:hypothetical protein
MAQCSSHPGEQLVHAEGFGDVVVGSCLKCLYFGQLIAAARQDNDRDPLVAASDFLQQLKSVNVRQTEIEDHEIGGLGQQPDGNLPVGRFQKIYSRGR